MPEPPASAISLSATAPTSEVQVPVTPKEDEKVARARYQEAIRKYKLCLDALSKEEESDKQMIAELEAKIEALKRNISDLQPISKRIAVLEESVQAKTAKIRAGLANVKAWNKLVDSWKSKRAEQQAEILELQAQSRQEQPLLAADEEKGTMIPQEKYQETAGLLATLVTAVQSQDPAALRSSLAMCAHALPGMLAAATSSDQETQRPPPAAVEAQPTFVLGVVPGQEEALARPPVTPNRHPRMGLQSPGSRAEEEESVQNLASIHSPTVGTSTPIYAPSTREHNMSSAETVAYSPRVPIRRRLMGKQTKSAGRRVRSHSPNRGRPRLGRVPEIDDDDMDSESTVDKEAIARLRRAAVAEFRSAEGEGSSEEPHMSRP